MKKIGLFIITLFFCMTAVEAKTYSNYNVGDIVTLSKGTNTTSEWRVIETSDSSKETVKLFKSTNAIESIAFDEKATTAIYENSSIKTHVDEYGLLLNLGDDLKSISLISVEELNSIGCETWTCKNAPEWVYSSFYWTSTPYTEFYNYAYRVSIYKDITPVCTWDLKIGIRPVIVVSKDAVLNGYTNEEKTFDEINISCNKELIGSESFECYIKMDKNIQKMNFDISIEGISILDKFSIENITWNEALSSGVNNNGIYEIKNNVLTKKTEVKDSDLILKLTGNIKNIKTDQVLKFKLSNISMYDEYGDYQNISEIEKELKVLKTIENQELIENPNTGIKNITIIILVAVILCGIGYLIVVKYNKKTPLNK